MSIAISTLSLATIPRRRFLFLVICLISVSVLFFGWITNARQMQPGSRAQALIAGPNNTSTHGLDDSAVGQIVISQVYGSGGTQGAYYQNSFIEVFNRGAAQANLSSVVFLIAPESGDFTRAFSFQGPNLSMEPGQSRLISVGQPGSGSPLPQPDLIVQNGSLGYLGAVAIVAAGATLQPRQCISSDPSVVDLVGFGSTFCFEGNQPTGWLNATVAAVRLLGGCFDTKNNLSDFTIGQPLPRNGNSPFNMCSPTPTPTPSQGQVVISQLYGGGGRPGAVYRNSFIEVFNRGNTTADLNDLIYLFASDQANLTSGFGGLGLGAFLIEPGQYRLIKLASEGNTGSELPQADYEVRDLVIGPSGKFALVSGSAGYPGGPCPPPNLYTADVIGYGSTNCYEGSAPTVALSVTSAAIRLNGGCSDSNNNVADFIMAPPDPHNGSSPFHPCSPTPTPTPYADQIVISQVYGGDGSLGSAYAEGFLEVFNRGNTAADLSGLIYSSGPGDSAMNSAFSFLSGANLSMQPGQYRLIALGGNGNFGAALPQPDLFARSVSVGSSGKFAITFSNTFQPSLCPISDPNIVDIVGYGTTHCYEGTGPTGSLSLTTAAIRRGNGCADTKNNLNDFTIGPPNPHNGNSPFNPCASNLVTVSGRVLTSDLRGLRNTVVSMTDSNSVIRTVTTSSFGVFSFDSVVPGQQYTFKVQSRLFRYSPLTVAIDNAITLSDLVGLE